MGFSILFTTAYLAYRKLPKIYYALNEYVLNEQGKETKFLLKAVNTYSNLGKIKSNIYHSTNRIIFYQTGNLDMLYQYTD